MGPVRVVQRMAPLAERYRGHAGSAIVAGLPILPKDTPLTMPLTISIEFCVA
jgi:hypothetical protein